MYRECAWCGIEMKWWRVLTLRSFCGTCHKPFYSADIDTSPVPFHSRVGMKER